MADLFPLDIPEEFNAACLFRIGRSDSIGLVIT